MMANRAFLDTAYVIALASQADEHHARAVELSRLVVKHRVILLTTRAVCLEIANAFARARSRPVAVQLLEGLEASPSTIIIPASEELYRDGFGLYRNRQDKDWSLTDCVSFVVMQQHGLTESLTSDEHFEQAGFKALLR